MAEIALIGPRAARDLIFGVGGIDSATVLNWQNRNGLNPEQVLNRLAGAVGAGNEAIVARYRAIAYFTTDMWARYRQGVDSATGRKTPKKTEFAKTDPIRSDETGHLLPLGDYTDVLGWSDQYLRDAYESQIDADIELLLESWFLRVNTEIINRIFSNAEVGVGSGWSVPWAIGTGMNVNYIPPSAAGIAKPFDNSHTHFKYVAGTNAASHLTLLKSMVNDLRHHGISGRLVSFVSEADVDTWASVTGFIQFQPSGTMLVTGGSSAVATTIGETQGVPGEVFGYVNTNKGVVEMRYLENIPTTYAFTTKSYGENNPNNGVAIRLHPSVPFGLSPRTMIESSNQPRMESIKAEATHGVGVNKRLNGVAGRVADGISEYAWTTI